MSTIAAPPEDRERFAIPEARLPDARLVKFPGGEEALVVSTCNRTDLLARSRNGSLDLRAFLADYLQVPTAEFEPMSKAEYAPRSFQSPFPEVQTLAGC